MATAGCTKCAISRQLASQYAQTIYKIIGEDLLLPCSHTICLKYCLLIYSAKDCCEWRTHILKVTESLVVVGGELN